MFTFATTATALGMVSACTEDRGGDDTLYGCPSIEACESPDATLNDGAVYTIDGGYHFDAGSDAGPPDADDAAIDDSGDAGEGGD
jgi:hypothetical protein